MKMILKVMAALALAGMASPALAEEFTLSSPDIAEGAQLDSKQVFQGFGCDGGNIAPRLSWTGVPEGTKSFAVTAYDPDAPTGSGWWHWFVVNIPAGAEGVSPSVPLDTTATQLRNDYGASGFGGACPPEGEVHRYQFTVHALSTVLNLDTNATNALAGFMVNANSIASDTITAVYTR